MMDAQESITQTTNELRAVANLIMTLGITPYSVNWYDYGAVVSYRVVDLAEAEALRDRAADLIDADEHAEYAYDDGSWSRLLDAWHDRLRVTVLVSRKDGAA